MSAGRQINRQSDTMGNLFCGDAETYTLDAPETLVEMARKEGFVMSDDVVSSELAKDPDKVDMTVRSFL